MVSKDGYAEGSPPNGGPKEEKRGRHISSTSEAGASSGPSEISKSQLAVSRFVVANGVEEVLMRRFVKFRHTLCVSPRNILIHNTVLGARMQEKSPL